jgi:CO/xanthine dehydrogenase Mo-binding subunit
LRIDNHLHWTSDVALIYQDGQLLNSRLLDYRIPTMADLPAALRSILVENADRPRPHGSKSIGESGLTPTAPTIAPAIDVRLTALQLPPERVWQALRVAPVPQTA